VIDRIKREPGNDLLPYGGATFDQALSRFLLVDDRRMIQPAALGAGRTVRMPCQTCSHPSRLAPRSAISVRSIGRRRKRQRRFPPRRPAPATRDPAPS
jgi:hypothetical protein